MGEHDVIYKVGAWKLTLADQKSVLDKTKLLISCIEKLKSDIENNDPSDKRAQEMINEILYHYCWKLSEDEQID